MTILFVNVFPEVKGTHRIFGGDIENIETVIFYQGNSKGSQGIETENFPISSRAFVATINS